MRLIMELIENVDRYGLQMEYFKTSRKFKYDIDTTDHLSIAF
jgi:hypothetical protein